jgi:hypothetical protein
MKWPRLVAKTRPGGGKGAWLLGLNVSVVEASVHRSSIYQYAHRTCIHMQCNNSAPSLKHHPNAKFLVLIMSLEHSKPDADTDKYPRKFLGPSHAINSQE